MTTSIFKEKRKTAGQFWQLTNRIMPPGVFCLFLCSSFLNDLMTLIASCPLFSNPHAKSAILGCFSIHSLLTAVYSSPWSPGLPGERHKCTQDGQESNPGPSYSEATADNNYSTTPFMFSANLVCNLRRIIFISESSHSTNGASI